MQFTIVALAAFPVIPPSQAIPPSDTSPDTVRFDTVPLFMFPNKPIIALPESSVFSSFKLATLCWPPSNTPLKGFPCVPIGVHT